MRTSILLSKKNRELFFITTNLQFQHHIMLLLFLHCRFFVNLCTFRYLLLAVAVETCHVYSTESGVGVTDIAVGFRLFSSFVAHTICNLRNFNPKLMTTTCDVFLYGDVM